MAADPPTPIQRRIWRLAFLLTGNPDAASSLIERIRQARRKPESLEPAMLDRLIIQNARSVPRSDQVQLPATERTPGNFLAPAREALSAALRLPHQPLEAWVLRRLDDLDDLHIARAMDCSKSAARLHLAAADEAMNARLGANFLPSIDALRRFADALDPEPFILAHREQARKARKTRLRNTALLVAGATLILGYVALRLFTT